METVTLNRGAFQSRFKSCLLADFEHSKVTHGEVERTAIRKIVEGLNGQMSTYQIPIAYQASEASEMGGGSCSALTLKVAQEGLSYLWRSRPAV